MDWDKFYSNHPHLKKPKTNVFDTSQILSRLYLGSYDQGAGNYEGLKMLGITHILTVGHDMPPLFPNHFVYKVIPLEDHDKETIEKYFQEAVDFIDEALSNPKNKVLVHCYAGVSRSSTMIIAFLMNKYQMNYAEALEWVRQSRYWINPNKGFRQKIKELEKSLKQTHDLKKYESYEKASELLREMYTKNEINKKSFDNVLKTFESLFGTLNSFTLNVKKEMEPFLTS